MLLVGYCVVLLLCQLRFAVGLVCASFVWAWFGFCGGLRYFVVAVICGFGLCCLLLF